MRRQRSTLVHLSQPGIYVALLVVGALCNGKSHVQPGNNGNSCTGKLDRYHCIIDARHWWRWLSRLDNAPTDILRAQVEAGQREDSITRTHLSNIHRESIFLE